MARTACVSSKAHLADWLLFVGSRVFYLSLKGWCHCWYAGQLVPDTRQSPAARLMSYVQKKCQISYVFRRWGGVLRILTQRRTFRAGLDSLKSKWLNNDLNNGELFKHCLSHLLFFSLLPVIQEKQGSGQEKHAPQDDDEGTEHEGIAQTEETPQRRCSVALLKGIWDLQGEAPAQKKRRENLLKLIIRQNSLRYPVMLWHTTWLCSHHDTGNRNELCMFHFSNR